MTMPESFREYTELVCRQLRWKKARPVIGQEIGTHLCDQRDALMKGGMDEDAATRGSRYTTQRPCCWVRDVCWERTSWISR